MFLYLLHVVHGTIPKLNELLNENQYFVTRKQKPKKYPC
jgi:hypothetical protein